MIFKNNADIFTAGAEVFLGREDLADILSIALLLCGFAFTCVVLLALSPSSSDEIHYRANDRGEVKSLGFR